MLIPYSGRGQSQVVGSALTYREVYGDEKVEREEAAAGAHS